MIYFEECLLSESLDQVVTPLRACIAVVLLLLSHQVVVQLLLVRIEDQFFGLLTLL